MGQRTKESGALTLYQTIAIPGSYQQSQQHKESDHHTDQHTIYKISRGNQCPTSCQADASAEFVHFSEAFLFKHTTSSLKYPQSNRRAEQRGSSRQQSGCRKNPKAGAATTYNVNIVAADMLTLAFSSKHRCARVQPHRATNVASGSYVNTFLLKAFYTHRCQLFLFITTHAGH